MKTIMFYSGKGGVGKSTISAAVATYLSRENKVVYIDCDLSGPSGHILFPESSHNLTCLSLGYSTGDETIDLGYRAVKSVMRRFSVMAKEIDPDYIILDSAPGITDEHRAMINVFDISGIFMLSQKTQLSISKVIRTSMFFGNHNIPIAGIIFNMTGKFEDDIDCSKYKAIAEIPYVKSISLDEKRIVEASKLISKHISKTKESEYRKFTREVVFESVTIDDIENMVIDDKKQLKFYNVETWDYVVGRIEDGGFSLHHDQFLTYNNGRIIKEFLTGFDEDGYGMFKVIRPPVTEIKLFGSEIGIGKLVLGEKSHYGVPRLSYKTDDGEVILFPHEVVPVGAKFLNESLYEYKEMERLEGSVAERYIPKKEVFIAIYNQFGEKVSGSPSDYEKVTGYKLFSEA